MTYRPQDPRPGERGYGPVTPVEPNTETTRRAERPRDEQGLPMLTSGDVARDLGITDPNNYKHAAYKDVPHYIDTKSGDLNPTNNIRVWFALQHIVDHFAKKSGAGKPPEKKTPSEIAHTARYLKWHNAHQQALKTEEINKENGIDNGNLRNQPDPRNKDIHLRMVEGIRLKTEDDPSTGDLVGRTLKPGSNITNPIKNGSLKPVEGTSDEVIDFSNPNRPRRR